MASFVPNFVKTFWEKVLAEPRRRTDAEAAAFWASDAAKRVDVKMIVVFVTAAISLTLLEYVGMSNRYGRSVWFLDLIGLRSAACGLDAWMDAWSTPSICRNAAAYIAEHGIERTLNTGRELNRLTYWATWCMLGYFVIPALVVRFVLRERIVDYGLRLGGALKDAWIYVLMFAVVLPFVIYVSGDAHFQDMYPFYNLGDNEPLWPRFWIWECLYFSQFFALEFFFRGFCVHGVKHRLGYAAVFAAMVPYCMIHFGKPMPETIGAIIAGIALASLSLKARSIWLGVAIHASVALAMDFASLWRQGYFD